MSEQKEQAIAAKIRSRGLGRNLTILIIAPVFVCAALTFIAPIIQNNLARREAVEKCQTLPEQYATVTNSTVIETGDILGEAVITADNLEQMLLFDEVELGLEIVSRDTIAAVSHPNGDYVIYADYQPSEATLFFICNPDGEALGAFTADETAGDVVFNADGSLFAVSNGRLGRILIFDGMAIRRKNSLSVLGT